MADPAVIQISTTTVLVSAGALLLGLFGFLRAMGSYIWKHLEGKIIEHGIEVGQLAGELKDVQRELTREFDTLKRMFNTFTTQVAIHENTLQKTGQILETREMAQMQLSDRLHKVELELVRLQSKQR